MRRLVAALLVLAAFTGGQLAYAQSAPAPTIPSDALVPNEQARTAFEALRSHPLTDEIVNNAIRNAHVSTQPMDDIINRAFVPGDQVRGWQNAGIDLLMTIDRRDGGGARSMTESAGQFGPTLTYFRDAPIESFVRPEWSLIGRRGAAPVASDTVWIEIGHVSPKVIVAERVGYRRQGNAYCRVGAQSQVYADPAVPATEFDMIAVMITMRTLARMDSHILCQVTEESGQGLYRLRWFDSEGHRLPGLERDAQPVRIVPIPAGAGASR